MKTLDYLIALAFIIITTLSCEKDNNIADSIDNFCVVIPESWKCEIISENFNENDIPKNADTPLAIIKYINTEREFTSYLDAKVNPSLILDLYPIEKKNELIRFINSQQMYSWNIPVYYGETKKYFIITSPGFINGGSFNDDANASIKDLHDALKNIIIYNSYLD